MDEKRNTRREFLADMLRNTGMVAGAAGMALGGKDLLVAVADAGTLSEGSDIPPTPSYINLRSAHLPLIIPEFLPEPSQGVAGTPMWHPCT